jgi:flagellar biosynthesis/type III secretory pathway chaperone
VNTALSRLFDVLEEEIVVGEELSRNLAAQKHAIIGWDIAGLLQAIDAREPHLHSLAELEKKRRQILEELRLSDQPLTARQLIVALPEDAPERARLRGLRERTRLTFTRLHADEWNLHRLMENLQSHIQEALGPLTVPSVPLYGETGVPAPQRSSSAFICSKA